MHGLSKIEQIKYCAKSIYAEKLKNAGFVSYKGECTSWYKIANNEVVNSVYLYSALGFYPLLMEIGYGIHPLFIPAPIPQRVIFIGSHDDEVMTEVGGKFKYSLYCGTSVMCHNMKEWGAELLDTDVFPRFGDVKTEMDAYISHRKICIDRIEKYKENSNGGQMQIVGSEWLADEAIYFNDEEIQNMMISQLIHQREYMKNGDMMSTPTKREWYQKRIEAIQDGAREPFLMMLKARKKRFIRDLERKVGIQV